MINSILLIPPPGIKMSLFADDLVLWIIAHTLDVCFRRLQEALDALQVWSLHWGLRFSPSKTKAIIFMRPPLLRSSRYLDHHKVLTIRGEVIDIVREHKYLGLDFDYCLSWGPHIRSIRSSIVSKVNILKAISSTDYGADRFSILRLYKSMVRPKMEYGCVLYSSAAQCHLSTLNIIQNKCLRIATGCLSRVSTKVLEVEAGVPPLKYHFDKFILNTAASIVSTRNHPLRPLINDYRFFINSPYKPFSTRSHLCAVRYKLPISNMAPVVPLPLAQWARMRTFIVLNDHLRKTDSPVQLLQEVRSISSRFTDLEPFFTDGSKKDATVGSGVFSRLLTRGYRIPDGFSVFDAELFAIFTALTFIISESLHSVIYSDSQAALRAIHSGDSLHPLVNDINHKLLNTPLRIYLVWIPAHIGIHGNEMADSVAKRSLQYNIIHPAPVSPATFKLLVADSLLTAWRTDWSSFPNFKIRLEIVPFVTEFRSSRREELTLCRLRTGVTLYTDILPRINNVWPLICEFCDVEVTIKHLLLQCIAFHNERRPIVSYFRNANLTLTVFRLLQDNPEVIDLLLKYLKDTKLLRLL